jgi:alpha-L-rhamnosidase
MSRGKDERITIRPQVVDGLDWVRCGYGSKLGKIESDWKWEGGVLTMDVTIPAGASATVWVPLKNGEAFVDGGSGIGVTKVRMGKDAAVYRVGSGTYHLVVKGS